MSDAPEKDKMETPTEEAEKEAVKAPANAPIREKLGYHPILLGGIALLAGLLLVLADAVTRSEIAARLDEDLRASLDQVIDRSLYDNNPLSDRLLLHAPLEFSDADAGIAFYRARMKGEVVATAFRVIGMGYSGEIAIMMGIDSSGEILGVRVISHAETPGLGDKIEAAKDNWILGFTGLSLENRTQSQWAVKKDGGEFDQFSGATITPRAVVRAVHKGLQYFNAHREEILNTPAPVPHSNSSASAAAPNASNQGARSDVWQRQMNEDKVNCACTREGPLGEQRRVAAFEAQPLKEVRHG